MTTEITVVSELPYIPVHGESVFVKSENTFYVRETYEWVNIGPDKNNHNRHRRLYDNALPFTKLETLPSPIYIGDSVLLSTEGVTYTFNGTSWKPVVTPSDNYWINLATGWKEEPSLNTSLAGGDVYTYFYEGNITYYRYIANDGTIDAFYASFDGSILTDFVIEKKVTL